MKINVFIPGRLDSTRLPNKLILPLKNKNGKTTCLFDHACEILNKLPSKYGKYALIRDPELIEIAERYNNIEILKRPINTLNVDGPLNHIFGKILETDGNYFMFFNPCFMFVEYETIIRALEYFELKVKYEHINSMTSVKPFYSWLYDKDKLLFKVNENWSTKDIKDKYEPAHIFHIFSRHLLEDNNTMLGKHHATFCVNDEKECLDVDTEMDFKIVKCLYENGD